MALWCRNLHVLAETDIVKIDLAVLCNLSASFKKIPRILPEI